MFLDGSIQVIVYLFTFFFFVSYVCSHAAAVIGFGYLLHSAVNQLSIFTSGFHAYFLAPRGICRTNLKKYGSWGGKCYIII